MPIYKNKEEWLSARKIGSTDLCAIVNGKGRWQSKTDVYKRLVYGLKIERSNEAMSNGVLLEPHIKKIFLIANNLKEIEREDGTYLLHTKGDYLTLSPDCEIENNGFVEIKLKYIFKQNFSIENYLLNLKQEEPQYYWQLIHYFLVGDYDFGYLVVAFVKNGAITIDSLKITKEFVKDDIDLANEKVNDFITNNLLKEKTPDIDTGDITIWEQIMN